MTDGDPEDVALRFIFENIETVPQLEALLLIWQNSTRTWTAEELAARIYVGSTDAKNILDELRRRGLATHDPDTEAFQYASDWDPTNALMRRVAETYARNLVGIARMIHSKGSASVREFARAFQIKKD
jgi:hypothetical protein